MPPSALLFYLFIQVVILPPSVSEVIRYLKEHKRYPSVLDLSDSTPASVGSMPASSSPIGPTRLRILCAIVLADLRSKNHLIPKNTPTTYAMIVATKKLSNTRSDLTSTVIRVTVRLIPTERPNT
jgi:hypothetical protein